MVTLNFFLQIKFSHIKNEFYHQMEMHIKNVGPYKTKYANSKSGQS